MPKEGWNSITVRDDIYDQWTKVIDEKHLKQLMKIKSRDELVTKEVSG